MTDMSYIRRDSERAVTIGPGLVIDPFNVSTWPEEMQASHRIRRALHELMPDPRYRLEVGEKPDGSPGIRILCDQGVPRDAQAFLALHREQLITYLTWLELVDEYHDAGTGERMNKRLAVSPVVPVAPEAVAA